MQTFENQAAQGDLLFIAIDKLPDLDPTSYTSTEEKQEDHRICLAYGEATGHAHAFYNKNAVELRKAANSNKYFVVVGDGVAELKHEEHATLSFKKGKKFIVRKQQQYVWGEITNVAD